MDILEKINLLAKCNIEDYDNAGAHIKAHLIPLSNIVAVLNSLEKKKTSVFLNESLALESIHAALSNTIIQKRIVRWCTHPEYQNQTRMIIGYPMKKTIGYFYELKEPFESEYLALSSQECKNLCLVILRNPQDQNDFVLYSAYPRTINTSAWL